MQYFRNLRNDSTAAHVGPLAVFLILSMVPGWFRGEGPGQPWYVIQPEHWWFPVQTLLCGGLLWWWRQHYAFPPGKPRYYMAAFVLAAVGIAFWVLPGWLFHQWDVPSKATGWKWLGLIDRSRGFDPTLLAEHPSGQVVTITLRFVRSVLLVPLVEELCWRGWLMRYVNAGEKPFTSIPFGTHSWRAFWITTLAVTLVHRPEDWIAAFLWGTLVYFVAVKTKSLRACVIMHAFGNLLLGIYILRTGQYGYW